MNAHLDMTLRDWFAGMAMQGIYHEPYTWIDGDWVRLSKEAIAKEAYKQADAMLAERESKTPVLLGDIELCADCAKRLLDQGEKEGLI